MNTSIFQAAIEGIFSGVFECLFEKVSLGELDRLKEVAPESIKDILINFVKSTAVNASEEAATEAANVIYDTIALGDISNAKLTYDSYIEAGHSPKDARTMTAHDMAYQVLNAALSGALQGGVMSGVGSAAGYINNRSSSSDSAQTTAPDYTVQTEAANYDSLSEAQKLALELTPAVEKGTATAAERAIYKVASGERLTDSELRAIYSDTSAQSQIDSTLGTHILSDDYTRMAVELNTEAAKNATQSDTRQQLEQSERQGMMTQAQQSLNNGDAVGYYFDNVLNAPAQQRTRLNDAATAIMADSQSTAPDIAQSFRQSQATNRPADTVTLGNGSNFSDLDVSNVRKSQLATAENVMQELGITADIDVKGDILAQAGNRIYNSIKDDAAVNHALADYFGSQWSEFSAQQKADHAASLIAEAVRKDAAGQKLTSTEAALLRAAEKGANNTRFAWRGRHYESSRSIDDYSRIEYNRNGWAYVNDVLSVAESAAFNAKIAEMRNGSRDFRKSADGLYILEIGTHSSGRNVLVYTDGNWDSPSIEKVVKFGFEDEDSIEIARGYIYERERCGVSEAAEDGQNVFGEEICGVYRYDDYPSFQELTRERKGSSGAEDNRNSAAVSDGGRSSSEASESISGTDGVKDNPTAQADIRLSSTENGSDSLKLSRSETVRTTRISSKAVLTNLAYGRYATAQMRSFAEQVGIRLRSKAAADMRSELALAIKNVAKRSRHGEISLWLNETAADVRRSENEQKQREREWEKYVAERQRAQERKARAEQAAQRKAEAERKQAEKSAQAAEKARLLDNSRLNAEVRAAAKGSVAKTEIFKGQSGEEALRVEHIDTERFIKALPENRRAEMRQLIEDSVSFAHAFGHEVKFITDATKSGGVSVNGFYRNRNVYVNIEHIREMKLKTIAHEITHDMAANDTSLITGFYNLYREYCEKHGQMDEFNERINNQYNLYSDGVYGHRQLAVVEEMLCDTFADLASGDSRFFNYCVNRKPTLAQRIVEFINRIVNKLIRKGEPEAAIYTAEMQGYLLDAAAKYKAGRGIDSRLSGAVKADARSAQRIISKAEGKYQIRGDVRAHTQEWSGDISGNAAVKDLRTTAPRERTDYGFRDVIVGGKKQTVLIVDPQNYLASGTYHMETVEATRSLAATFGVPIGFTVGQSAEMTKTNGRQRELLSNYDSLRTDAGTLLINLDSNVPYTLLLTSAWCSWLRRADTAAAADIDRLARRIASLTGMDITAEKAVQQTFSGKRAERTAQAIRMRPDEVLAWMMEYPDTARAFAHENPNVVRQLCEKVGDVVLKALGKGNDRAASLTAQLQAKLLHTFSRTAEAAESMMRSEPSSRIEQRRGKRKKPLPDDMRLMSVKSMDDGSQYVEIDTDQERFDGLTASEMRKEARRVIIEKFKGKVIGNAKNAAYVNTRTADEFSHSANRRVGDDIVSAKMKSSTELDNLMSASRFISAVPDDGRHPDAINGWRRYSIMFKVNGRMLEGEISLKGTERGWVFYDLTKIKDTTGYQLVNAEKSGTPSSNGNVSGITIPYAGDTVNLSRTLRIPTQQENRAWLDDYAEQYGTIPEGENVNSRGDQRVPQQTDDDTRTRQTVRTYLEALSTPDDVVGALEREMINGTFAYTPVSNRKANDYANSILARGFDEAMAEWHGYTRGGKSVNKYAIALGERLIIEAANSGDTRLATKLIAEVAAEATRAGQVVQAISMVKRLSPAGQLFSIQRQVDKLNDERHGRGTKIAISEEKLKEFADIARQLESAQTRIAELESMLENGQERTDTGYTEDELSDAREREQQLNDELRKTKNGIITDVAEQVQPTWKDKMNAWRYLAMLGNPRTHIRNLTGNLVFIPAVRLKQAMASGMEHIFLKKGERTQQITASKSLREFAAQDAQEQLEWLKSGGKYNVTDEISEQVKAFSDNNIFGKTFNRLSDFNGWALDAEDGIFLRSHYKKALAGWAAANGVSAYQLRTDEALLQKARSFAAREAQRATYRDMNAFADFMSQVSRKLKAKQGLGGALAYAAFEGVVPFKKTPCNIVKRSIEYSPIGVISALAKGGRKLLDSHNNVSNDYTAAEFINDLSAGMTGTMIVGLGALMASIGVLRGRNKDDEDEFEKLQGAQEYSLVIDGHSYTIDWMSPVALPLFVGAELYDQVTNTNENISLKSLLDSLTMIAEPIFNLSMLDGVQSVLQSYSSEGAIVDVVFGALESYAGQFFPTLGGQIARSIDPLTRNAYYSDNNSPLPRHLSQIIRSATAKTPFAYSQLPERIDAWGRNTGEGQSTFERIAENFISPGYYSRQNTTEVDRLIQEIYDATGDSSVLPSTASKSFSYNGERYYMSAEEYVTYAKTRGQTAYSIIDELRQSKEFAKLSAGDKATCISDAYKLATVIAKLGTDSGYTEADIQYAWQRKAYETGDYAQAILDRR